jgi:hypothetical protein
MTWRAAIRRLRILRAIDLLADIDLPVTRIAIEVGYSSLSAFNTAFRDLAPDPDRVPQELRPAPADAAPVEHTPPEGSSVESSARDHRSLGRPCHRP